MDLIDIWEKTEEAEFRSYVHAALAVAHGQDRGNAPTSTVMFSSRCVASLRMFGTHALAARLGTIQLLHAERRTTRSESIALQLVAIYKVI